MFMKKSIEEEDVYIESDSSEGQKDESFSFAKLGRNNRKQSQLGEYDPNRQYLSVHRGLNFKGVCSTKGCIAEKKKVWIKKGYGKINVGMEICKSNCPCCFKRIHPKTVTTLGFRRAIVDFEGMKQDQQQIFSYHDEERKGELVKFVDEKSKMTEWRYLMADVKKIK